MSLDLFQGEAQARLETLPMVMRPEASAFDGFIRGTGTYAMRGFAQTARAFSMAGAVAPIAIDAVTGGTELQDKYFASHDEVFGNAVDYWTPKPDEVGVAGQIVGQLLYALPMTMVSPSTLVFSVGMSQAEDLAEAGVEPWKAVATGTATAGGLGLGIYMPIFGQSLWQRMLIGGAGFNVLQGAAMRGAGQVILKGTPAEGQFEIMDPTAITLDVLMGLGFGAITHLSPAQRAQGEQIWKRLTEWMPDNAKASELDALSVLRQAQHMNVDSLPGKPVDALDIEAHVNRMKAASDQVLRGETVDVNDLPAGRFEPDPERFTAAKARADDLMDYAKRVAAEERIPLEKAEGPMVRASETPPRGEADSSRPSADLLASEARRYVSENPDKRIVTGFDTDGNPVHKSARQFLGDTDASVKQAKEDAKLFGVAAKCLLGLL